MATIRRSISRIDVSNYNTLLYHDYDANVNFTKNYFLTQSPPPMSFRDLRSVMTNITPSNVVVLSESSNPSKLTTKSSPIQNTRKYSARKSHKRQIVDVYRTLSRTESRCSVIGDRDITNNEMMLLSNSFVIDYGSTPPTSGFFHPQNLPNIQKHRVKTGNSQTRTNHLSYPSLRIEHVGQIRSTSIDQQNKNITNQIGINQTKSSSISRMQHIRYTQPSPPQLIHRTTPVDIQYEEDNSQMTITRPVSPVVPEVQTRKQLHIYMPQIISC